jgi:hypothetical protein
MIRSKFHGLLGRAFLVEIRSFFLEVHHVLIRESNQDDDFMAFSMRTHTIYED